MTYELAKELKDAGFPQKYRCACPDCKGIDGDSYVPALSELIEACGVPFYSLHVADGWDGKEWFASLNHDNRKLIANGPGRSGKTPEEAVARLWLALNEKA